MRTTLNLPDAIIKKAKRMALEEGTTLTDLIVRGLQHTVENTVTPGLLPISSIQGGLAPGVTWSNLTAPGNSDEEYR